MQIHCDAAKDYQMTWECRVVSNTEWLEGTDNIEDRVCQTLSFQLELKITVTIFKNHIYN